MDETIEKIKPNILLLDDQVHYLNSAKEIFSKRGFQIKTQKDCGKVLEEGLNGNYDIILSDLDLQNISETETGLTILEKIRNKNNSVFLGLYTAYEYTLGQSERRKLDGNNIKIYKKDVPDAFLNDLFSDYAEYQKSKENEKEEFTEIYFFELIKEDVLNHLRKISNQKVLVPISNVDYDIPVSELYNEVNNRSKIGRRFMIDWYESIKFINELKNKKR